MRLDPALGRAVARLAADAVAEHEAARAPRGRDVVRMAREADTRLLRRLGKAQLARNRCGALAEKRLVRVRMSVVARPGDVFILERTSLAPGLHRAMAETARAARDTERAVARLVGQRRRR